MLKPLLEDKILVLSKLKTYADDKFNCGSNAEII